MKAKRQVILATAAALTLLISGCVGPGYDDGGYYEAPSGPYYGGYGPYYDGGLYLEGGGYGHRSHGGEHHFVGSGFGHASTRGESHGSSHGGSAHASSSGGGSHSSGGHKNH